MSLNMNMKNRLTNLNKKSEKQKVSTLELHSIQEESIEWSAASISMDQIQSEGSREKCEKLQKKVNTYLLG